MNTRINRLSSFHDGSRTVRVMADFTASGLWDESGRSLDLSEVPMSSALAARLDDWTARYDRTGMGDLTEGQYDVVGLAEEGRAVAQTLKNEHPAWTVIYFDESALPAGDTPAHARSAFEFEMHATLEIRADI